MAAAFLRQMSGGRIVVRSAGSEPAKQLNPSVVAALNEVGLDISSERPALLLDEMARQRRCHRHDGLRGQLPRLPRQAVRGLGGARSLWDADRERPPHPG